MTSSMPKADAWPRWPEHSTRPNPPSLAPKPQEAPSQNAIIGRYILTPRIFEMIEQLTPGAGGELQLTDAIKALLKFEQVYGFHYVGQRYDAGDKLGFLKATVDFAIKHDGVGPAFREWLKSQKF